MTESSTIVYLEEILDATDRIRTVLVGVDLQKFTGDYRTRYSVMRSLEIIERSIDHVPADFKSKYAHIPWDDLAGYKSLMSTEGERYNFSTIWKVVKEDIPKIAPEIDKVLMDFESIN